MLHLILLMKLLKFIFGVVLKLCLKLSYKMFFKDSLTLIDLELAGLLIEIA